MRQNFINNAKLFYNLYNILSRITSCCGPNLFAIWRDFRREDVAGILQRGQVGDILMDNSIVFR